MRVARTRNSFAGAAALFFALASLLWSAASLAASPALDTAEIAWQRLEFRVPDRPDDIRVMVTLSDAAPHELAALRDSAPPEAPLSAVPLQRMTALVDIFAANRSYRTDVWFEVDGLKPVERRRDKIGKRANRKDFRYLAEGVRRLRIEPDNRSEAKRPPEEWSAVQERFFPYGPARTGCPVLLDPNLLFVVAAAGAVGAEPLELCVFNKQTVHRVRLSAEPGETLAADYLEIAGETGNPERREVRRPAEIRRIRIEAFPPEGDGLDADPFEFVEMRGEIEIDLDVESRLPLRVAGDVSGFGRVEFLLGEVTLRP